MLLRENPPLRGGGVGGGGGGGGGGALGGILPLLALWEPRAYLYTICHLIPTLPLGGGGGGLR